MRVRTPFESFYRFFRKKVTDMCAAISLQGLYFEGKTKERLNGIVNVATTEGQENTCRFSFCRTDGTVSFLSSPLPTFLDPIVEFQEDVRDLVAQVCFTELDTFS